MYFVGNPGVHLSILVKNSFVADQAGRIENMPGPTRIDLEHRAALNIDVMLAGFLLQTFGVLIWDFDGKFRQELVGCFKNRGRMGELGKHYEPHWQKRGSAR